MENDSWELQQISDFVYLLRKAGESKTILQHRFKKDQAALRILYELIEKLDELGYEDGISFGFGSHRLDTIRNHGDLGLIEIRVKDTLWRVFTHWSRRKKVLVILDAYKAHRHTTTEKEAKLVLPRARQAKKLVEEIDLNDDEN